MLSKLREYLKYLIPFALGVFVFALITDYDSTVKFLSGLFGGLVYVLSRFFWGFSIAYILNFFVKWLGRRFKFPFWLAVTTSYLLLIGVIVWMIVYIVPYMALSVEQIVKAIPSFKSNAESFVTQYFSTIGAEGVKTLLSFIDNVSNQVTTWASGVVDMSTLWPAVQLAGRSLVNVAFGFLISIYALTEKDKILASGRKLMYAFMKREKVEARIQFCSEANEIFSGYIVGKFVDSFIVGIASAILYAIFGLKMTPFLAFIAFLFNMIPYFGPFIGMFISGAILLCFSPLQALYCIIISIALQTLDGAFIAPKILGDSVGISPLLTIVAISVGGDLGGLLGIFLGVPILATFKTLVIDRLVERRLKKKEIAPEVYTE